jgi:ankyrin repeat protein
LEVIKLLMSSGADVNAKTKDGRTVLYFATKCDRLKVMELLRASGAME